MFTVCHKSNKFIVYFSILLEMAYYEAGLEVCAYSVEYSILLSC